MTDPAWLLLLGIASYRLTRAVARDSLTSPVRDAVTNWAISRPTSRARAALDTLINCTYCTGWWVSAALLAVWLPAAGHWSGTPVVIHGIEWAVVAGFQSLLSTADDALVESTSWARAEAAALENPNETAASGPDGDGPEDNGPARVEAPIMLPTPGPDTLLSISYSAGPSAEGDDSGEPAATTS